jgi:hypothetical protein
MALFIQYLEFGKTKVLKENNAMDEFIREYADSVTGVINGFDRLRFRGTLRLLANVAGLSRFLNYMGVLLKDTGAWMQDCSEQVKKASLKMADNAGRPVQYITNPSASKEKIAREIAQKDGIEEGLVCVLTAVEPCSSFDIHRDREQKKLVLVSRWRKCLHLYHYYLHPQWGLMHMRLQTWFPFNLWSCLNGREGLAKQLDQHQIGYRKRENCLIAVENLERVQELANAQLQTDWTMMLNNIAQKVHPIQRTMFAHYPMEYYWSCQDSEWASDIMFRSPQALSQLYPHLIRHGMQNLSCEHVMRFLGRKAPTVGGRYGTFAGEVVSNLKERPEGIRLKHYVNGNSVKMYDKQGSVLRIETTIIQPRDFKVYRGTEAEPEARKWRRMRKGVADLPRRAAVSQASNDRYSAALASAHCSKPLKDLAKDVCRRKQTASRPVRAINPLAAADALLLETVNRGEFAINGFRNRDLRKHIYPQTTADKKEQRKRSASVTRKLRILRMHGLIKKVSKTNRYVLTSNGFQIITALLAARSADVQKLIAAA